MVVRFKLDENIPRDAAASIRGAGYNADSAVDEDLDGHPDAELLDACRREDRVLITLDLDFADIRTYPPSTHAGVWEQRPRAQNIENVLAVLRGAIHLLATERAAQRLWIVEQDPVRILDE